MDNPVEGAGPILIAHRHESDSATTVLTDDTGGCGSGRYSSLPALKEKEYVMSVVKKFAALATGAALFITLGACSGSPESDGNARGGGGDTAKSLAERTQYNPQDYDNLKDGGTLTTALGEISPQWNIFQGDATAYSLALWTWYNPVLTTFAADGKPAFNSDSDLQK